VRQIAHTCFWVDRSLSSWERFLAEYRWDPVAVMGTLLQTLQEKLGAQLQVHGAYLAVVDTFLVARNGRRMPGVQTWKEVLETFVTCPYCKFPEAGEAMADLPARLAQLEAQLADLWTRWQEQLFNELPALADRLALLPPARRALIEGLRQQSQLPDVVSDELLGALHELASDLQPVELRLADLAQVLLARGSALAEDDLRAGLDAYLADLLKGHDRALVRFKIVLSNGEEE